MQPLLHQLVTVLAAPTVALSESSGQIRPGGASGLYCADVRVLSRAELSAHAPDRLIAPEPIWHDDTRTATAEFLALLRRPDATTDDPIAWIRRRRTVRAEGMTESLTIENATDESLAVNLVVHLAADLADMELVKRGGSGYPVVFEPRATGVGYCRGTVIVGVSSPELAADLAPTPTGASVEWPIEVAARQSVSVSWALKVSDGSAAVQAADVPADLAEPQDNLGDPRLTRLVHRSLSDIRGLIMSASRSPGDYFVAAGSPWYFTLFGRDALWTARMLLPVSVALAGSTLRALAAFQGRQTDARTEEQPGRIPHEIRRPETSVADPMLPPVYYGSIDATPLWICLLGDAWRAGLPPGEVRALLPALQAALRWLVDHGDSDGDGLLEYAGGALRNQGWKDSTDAVRFADGRYADGPVALCEVQAYAHQAALDGAALLDAFDLPGAERWRLYANGLRRHFRERFWCSDRYGRFPAMALDGRKHRIDTPSSNMGHLLGTGLLDAGESEAVANRLLAPDLASGFGLRTMSAQTGGYSPLSYHCGSVWPHDTAIAIRGLLRDGHHAAARTLAEQLLVAGNAFEGRFPELFGGFSTEQVPRPVPYPAACRPQAWSAASAIVVLDALSARPERHR